jgi:hypothetical protein
MVSCMANNKITTIKLLRETKNRLDKLRIHKRETYDEILQRTLGILNLTRVNPERAQTRLRVIERRTRRKNAGQKLVEKEDISLTKKV